jgi:hypothetical protein
MRLDSPSIDSTSTNLVTGTFRDRALEAEFQAEHFDLAVKRFTRFSIALSSAGFFAFGLHDAYVLGSLRAEAWAIRYGVFGPIGAAVFAFTFSRAYARFHQFAMLVFGMSLNLVVMWIGAIAPPDGFFIYRAFRRLR